jgi:hypothetical protein
MDSLEDKYYYMLTFGKFHVSLIINAAFFQQYPGLLTADRIESVTQKVLLGNAVLAAFMSGRKHEVIHQNGDCSREINVRVLFFRNIIRYQNAPSLQNSIWKRSTLR